MLHNPSKDVADWSVGADFKSLLNFKMFWGKSGSVKLVCSWICRYENIMVNLDVQLWELGTHRLHQGLSETILVNTLTDVREFENCMYVLLVLTSIQLINNTINELLYKGTQTSHDPSWIQTHNTSTMLFILKLVTRKLCYLTTRLLLILLMFSTLIILISLYK